MCRAVPFARTLRSLEADSLHRWGWTVAVALTLLAGWSAWLGLGRLTVYVASSSARLEASATARTVEAPVAGRLSAVAVALGEEIARGQTLFELDVADQRLGLDEARGRLAAASAELEALDAKEENTRRAGEEALRASAAAVAAARARAAEAAAAERYAARELDRLHDLHASGLVADRELDRGEAELATRRAATEALDRGLDELTWTQRSAVSEREGELERLRRERAAGAGEVEAARSAIRRLEHEEGLRRVVAPVAGRVGRLAPLGAGAVVAAGDHLATVVPQDGQRVVALFAPAAALGAVRPAQPARVRLDRFPALQYGTLGARVIRVASEPEDALLRVELELTEPPPGGVALEHGLTGRVEVAVERLSPFALVLRAAGKLWQEGGEAPPTEVARTAVPAEVAR